jgi:Ser/Thr protein kinase RdoA (MazF antagonist)
MTTADQLVRDALASHTSDFEFRGEPLSNDRHVVREVTFRGERAVCKLAREDSTGVRRGALVLQRLADSDAVPVPDLLARGEDHYVASFAAGGEYDGTAPRQRRERRLRDAGATLARLHETVAFESPGELTPRDDHLDLDARESWAALFAEWVADWSDALTGTRFEALGEDVQAFVRDHPEAFAAAGDPVLVHADYGADNLRFDGDSVSSVIDWEVARSAPGEFDLVRAELGWFDDRESAETDRDLRTALFAGYESVRSLRDGFGVRRAVYRAALMVRRLRNAEAAAGQSEVSVGDLEAVIAPFVRDRLDAARAEFE